jgi:hypothetical protein
VTVPKDVWERFVGASRASKSETERRLSVHGVHAVAVVAEAAGGREHRPDRRGREGETLTGDGEAP